jgi:hypothetical protein
MEKHLEAFLVANWNQTILSKNFSIYEEDGEPVGQQYATDARPIDVHEECRRRRPRADARDRPGRGRSEGTASP